MKFMKGMKALHLECGRRAPALQHHAMLGEQAA
jgi:hypothetical protein